MIEQCFKLKEGRSRLDIRKKFTVIVVRHRDRLPRAAVNAPSLEMSVQIGQGSQQPGLVIGVLACATGLGTR